MTRFDPSLLLTRMVIGANARTVYDEAFHPRLNIILGESASGKSTILNFIFYGLGCDLSEWSDAARRCTRVVIEAEISGMPVTLAREVSEAGRQPMDIFGGPYALAQRHRAEWNRYPYQRSKAARVSLRHFSACSGFPSPERSQRQCHRPSGAAAALC